MTFGFKEKLTNKRKQKQSNKQANRNFVANRSLPNDFAYALSVACLPTLQCTARPTVINQR